MQKVHRVLPSCSVPVFVARFSAASQAGVIAGDTFMIGSVIRSKLGQGQGEVVENIAECFSQHAVETNTTCLSNMSRCLW